MFPFFFSELVKILKCSLVYMIIIFIYFILPGRKKPGTTPENADHQKSSRVLTDECGKHPFRVLHLSAK